jgi:rSAM/selenodomain-associated transferase 1
MPLSQVALILIAKHPTPGRVKTRLTTELSPEHAAAVHRVFVQHLIGRLARLAPAELVVCFDPPEQGGAMRELFGNDSVPLTFLPQAPGDLGARLAAAAREVGKRHARLLLLGVDSPDVPVSHVFKGAELTDRSPVSLSPTTDGGYWSLGLQSSVDASSLLANIPWSSGSEAMATLRAAESLGLTAATGLAWDDVDYPMDLRRLLQRLPQSAAAADRELLIALLRVLPEDWLS